MDKTKIEALKAPLPPQAISQHPTKPYLSTIKAIYIVERLNEVFGLGGWKVENEFVEKAKVEKFTKLGVKYLVDMVVVKSKFKAGDIYVEAYGGNDNDDLGDAYKGACTDALSKIGSYLYVGMDVYKGLGNAPQTHQDQPGRTIGVESDILAGFCKCGGKFGTAKSKKVPNVGRAFFTCPKPRGSQCVGFMGWVDEANKESTLDLSKGYPRVTPDEYAKLPKADQQALKDYEEPPVMEYEG